MVLAVQLVRAAPTTCDAAAPVGSTCDDGRGYGSPQHSTRRSRSETHASVGLVGGGGGGGSQAERSPALSDVSCGTVGTASLDAAFAALGHETPGGSENMCGAEGEGAGAVESQRQQLLLQPVPGQRWWGLAKRGRRRKAAWLAHASRCGREQLGGQGGTGGKLGGGAARHAAQKRQQRKQQ